jgi:hypothetical protein
MRLTEKSPQNIWRSITQLATAAASSTTLAIWNHIQKCETKFVLWRFHRKQCLLHTGCLLKDCKEHWSHEYLSWESRNLQFEHWVIWNSLCYHCLQADTTGWLYVTISAKNKDHMGSIRCTTESLRNHSSVIENFVSSSSSSIEFKQRHTKLSSPFFSHPVFSSFLFPSLKSMLFP